MKCSCVSPLIMKTPSFLLAACALMLLALVPCAQAQTKPGAVSGRVQSEVTGQYLLTVRVTVKDMDLGTENNANSSSSHARLTIS